MKALTITVGVKDGKCQWSDGHVEAIRAYVQPLEGKAVTVSFARPRSTRSLKQNAYLWAAVYPAVSDHTGMTTEDIHEWCKDEFLPRRFVTLAGKEKEIRKTTTDLTIKEFGEFVERIVAWAAQELGVSIPEPS